MTAQSGPRITYLINTLADWLRHRRELDEIRQLDRGEFDRIAADLEIPSSDLEELVRRGLHAADELPLLLKALEIDEAALERTASAGAARHGTGLYALPSQGKVRHGSRRRHVGGIFFELLPERVYNQAAWGDGGGSPN